MTLKKSTMEFLKKVNGVAISVKNYLKVFEFIQIDPSILVKMRAEVQLFEKSGTISCLSIISFKFLFED